jgi:hypothetical protein
LSASLVWRSFSAACWASKASNSLRCSLSLPVSRSTLASSRFSASHRRVASSLPPPPPAPSPSPPPSAPRRDAGLDKEAVRSASRIFFSSSPMRLASLASMRARASACVSESKRNSERESASFAASFARARQCAWRRWLQQLSQIVHETRKIHTCIAAPPSYQSTIRTRERLTPYMYTCIQRPRRR